MGAVGGRRRPPPRSVRQIVDPRTGQKPSTRPDRKAELLHVGASPRTLTETLREDSHSVGHRRSSSFDGQTTFTGSKSRSPSPSIVGRMTDEQRYLNGIARARNSPSPGARNQVKYTRKQHKPSSPVMIAKQSPTRSPADYTMLSASPRSSSTAKKQLERELDVFCEELAEINQLEENIDQTMSNLHIQNKRGNKPGDLKQLATPPRERFRSPKHHELESAPPVGTGVLRPVAGSATVFSASAPPVARLDVASESERPSAFFPAKSSPSGAVMFSAR